MFRGSSFCKYVCPVGQFNFVVSTLSPSEVRVKERGVCAGCDTHDCIRGNDRARGCELRLFQPTKSGNMDCTFCLDCVRACPSHNVALLPRERPRSIEALMNRSDVAALAAVMVFGAFVNAAGMLERLASVVVEPLRFALFIVAGAVLLPALCIGVCVMANAAFLPRERVRETALRSVRALVPVGTAMWAAHVFVHIAPASTATTTLRQIDILMLDAGILATVFALWKIAGRHSIPWLVLATALYAAGVWILFQPMRMPGMSM
jgi:polyferredoxin